MNRKSNHLAQATVVTLTLAQLLMSSPAAGLSAMEADRLYGRVNVLLKARNRTAAHRLLSGAARDPAAPARVFLLKGVVERELGRLADAEKTLRVGVKKHRDDAVLWLELATTVSWRGALAAALASYRKAAALRPNAAAPQLGIGRILRWQGKRDAAEKTYRRLLAARPKSSDAWAGLGDVQQDDLQLEAARKSYQRALRLNGGSVAAAEGLRRLETVRRWRVALRGQRAWLGDGTTLSSTANGVQLELTLQATRAVQVAGGYGLTLVGIAANNTLQSAIWAGASRRTGRWTTTAMARYFPGKRLGADLELGVARDLGGRWTAQVAARPGFRNGGIDLLARAGLTRALPQGMSVTGLVFVAPSPSQPTARAVALSLRVDRPAGHSLAMSAARGWQGSMTTTSLAINGTWSLTSALDLQAGYEQLFGLAGRRTATAGVRWRW